MPQANQPAVGAEVDQAPGESAFEAAAIWLEDEYVTLIEDGTEPELARPSREDTQLIWVQR